MKIKPTQKKTKIFLNHQKAFEALSTKDHYKFLELFEIDDFHDNSKVEFKIKCGEIKNGYYESIVTVKVYS